MTLLIPTERGLLIPTEQIPRRCRRLRRMRPPAYDRLMAIARIDPAAVAEALAAVEREAEVPTRRMVR